MRFLNKFVATTAFTALITIGYIPMSAGQATSPKMDSTKTDAKSKKKKSSPTPTATPADIAAAKASGKVWVNTETKVYHKDGQFYGATKKGKFMTEADAQKAGYRAAKS